MAGRPRLLAAALVVPLLLGLVLLLGRGPEHDSGPGQGAAQFEAPAADAGPVLHPAGQGGRQPVSAVPETPAGPGHAPSTGLPAASLRGADVDGAIRFDAQGRLIVDMDLRRNFDQWLAQIGELELAELRRLFAERVLAEHPPERAAQVLDAFERYLAYLEAVDQLALPADASLLDRLDAVAALQQAMLGETDAEAWFGAENRYTALALAAASLYEAAVLAEGDAGLTAKLAAQAEGIGHHAVLEQSLQFEAGGVDAATRHAERSALHGEEAAQRLAELDAEQARWQALLQGYAAERARVDGLPLAERQRALEAWMQARDIDDPARRRLRSLDQAGLLPGA